MPVLDYLAKFSAKSLTPLTASEKTPLTTVIDKLASSKVPKRGTPGTLLHPLCCTLHACRSLPPLQVHRLWVTDNEGKPKGVISLTDLMKIYISEDVQV